MSLEEGQKALRTFHAWCDAEGIKYDREVRHVVLIPAPMPHRRSRDSPKSGCPVSPTSPMSSPLSLPFIFLTFPLHSLYIKALEIRTFVDGSSSNQNAYHYAVYSKRDITEGEVVVSEILKQSCLSARTSACAPALHAERLGGGLALNVAIMYERLLGDKSKWHGYFAILPHKGERTLPMFWSDEKLNALNGTEIIKHVRSDKQALREDYDEHVINGLCVNQSDTFNLETYSKPGSFELYLEAASLAASRAFFIGEIAGEALVPIADMFNHRTDSETVRVFGADDDVGGDGDGDGDGDEEDEQDSEDDASEEFNASEDSEDSNSVDVYDVPITGALEIRCCYDTTAGCELFNTFGQQNNASLLHKYGFCETDNKHTTVNVNVELIEQVLGRDKIRKAALSMGVDLDEENYFEIDPDGEVEESLLALVARVHRESEDSDDPPQETKEVRDSLRDVLSARLHEILDNENDEIRGACRDPQEVPAGGGVVGVDAAEVLRQTEIDLLNRALEGIPREEEGGKRKRK